MRKVTRALAAAEGQWADFAPQRALQRLRRADPEAAALVALVANARAIDPAELFRHNRCAAPIATTRQLAMYLANVALGRTMTEIGALFGRDRTTVSHACARIEDLREGAFDEEVERLERALVRDVEAGAVELERRHAHG